MQSAELGGRTQRQLSTSSHVAWEDGGHEIPESNKEEVAGVGVTEPGLVAVPSLALMPS